MTFKPAVVQEAQMEMGTVKIATYRRGAGKFFEDMDKFWADKKIKQVISMAQSESEGNITLTIAYI
jgi:hypothetical protein